MDRMQTILYEAALEGNVTALTELLQQDRLILDRVIVNCLDETPLHVAAMLGHSEFVEKILDRKPELSKQLDSQRLSPLHLASAKGYVEIVKKLLRVSPDMCFVCDQDGRNPLHLAAIKGQVDVLKELVQARPFAAQVTVHRNETILHLCVKYNQLEALKILVESLDNEFVKAKENDGFTVLHLAVAEKQIETVNFRINNTRVEINAINVCGFTALDLLTRSRRHVKDLDISKSLRGVGALKTSEIPSVADRTRASIPRHMPLPVRGKTINFLINNTRVEMNAKSVCGFTALDLLAQSRRHVKDWEIAESLQGAGALRTSEIPSVADRTQASTSRHVRFPVRRRIDTPSPQNHSDKYTKREDWFAQKQEPLMVVASLIATMAFQSGLNPPGGVWQDDTKEGSKSANNAKGHDAGTAIMCTNGTSSDFIYSNTIGFVASLSIILLLVTGLPFKLRFFMWILTGVMWVAISSMAYTYATSLSLIAPGKCAEASYVSVGLGVYVWIGVMSLLLLGHIIRIIVNLARKHANCSCPGRTESMDGSKSHTNV